jgi:hypothetical protein
VQELCVSLVASRSVEAEGGGEEEDGDPQSCAELCRNA